MSSKRSLLGSEGRTCMSWVILQRRLPRRSVWAPCSLAGTPVVCFLVIKSCCVAMRAQSLRGNSALRPRREYPSEATKPIAETYLKGSRTFPRNRSTEVPKKEESARGKNGDKALIEKKKRENSPKVRKKLRIGTNPKPTGMRPCSLVGLNRYLE